MVAFAELVARFVVSCCARHDQFQACRKASMSQRDGGSVAPSRSPCRTAAARLGSPRSARTPWRRTSCSQCLPTNNRTTALLRSSAYLPYEFVEGGGPGAHSASGDSAARRPSSPCQPAASSSPAASGSRSLRLRAHARIRQGCEHILAWCELTGPLHDGEVTLRCAADTEGRGIGLAVEAVSRRLGVHALARRHRRETRELDERPGNTIARALDPPKIVLPSPSRAEGAWEGSAHG